MISEEEIRKDIKRSLEIEKELLENMLNSLNENGDYCGNHIDELKEIYTQRGTLEWVLSGRL